MIFLEIMEKFRSQINRSLMVNAAELTLSKLAVSQDDALTIVITNDQKIHELNFQFRGVDSPTDVLSFPGGYKDPETDTTYLGDVIISFPQAQTQAEELDHPTHEELQLLIIHGVLHLFGFDHKDDEEKTKMWAIQDEILENLNLSIGYVT